MRIGFDFDNTLVCYEDVFALESKNLGFMPVNWRGSKQELKDELLRRSGGERLWQTLQGRVYGFGMEKAVLFPGVAPFLMRSRYRGDEMFIVSHKTEYGHFDSTKTPLREAALTWMESRGFFEKSRFGLAKENVFFEETRSKKVDQIAQLKLDIFIDDLEEVFSEEGFPPITKLLFNVKAKGRNHDLHCNNWSDIGEHILGPVPDVDCKRLAQTFCPERIDSVTRLLGHGNSRTYQVLTNTSKSYCLKSYPDQLVDPRPRLRNEVNACNLLEDLRLTPRSVAHDEELNLALFEWIDGDPPGSITTKHIGQALSFVKKLKAIPEDVQNNYPEASEACLSGTQLISQVQERIENLESIDNMELQQFLKISIRPLWQETRKWFGDNWPNISFETKLVDSRQTLSPSDFGFHNSLQRADGSLWFVDLEYFGRDDPVKLITDFLWHPAMNLQDAHKTQWSKGVFEIFSQDLELRQRFRAAWPAYALRWALIMLNEFLQEGWRKRIYAKPELEHERDNVQQHQLLKAAKICERVRREKLECPYV